MTNSVDKGHHDLEQPLIGHRIRQARQAQRMTLEGLSSQSGLTKGFLSRLERDQANASVAALLRVCSALEIPVGSLFEDSAPSQVVRASMYPRVNFGGRQLTEYLLTPPGEKRLQAIVSEIGPGGGSGNEDYALPSEVEFLMVLTGKLNIRSGSYDVDLNEGDAMTLDPTEPHTFTSMSPDLTKVLWVFAPALPTHGSGRTS